jgi:hypothetical protein
MRKVWKNAQKRFYFYIRNNSKFFSIGRKMNPKDIGCVQYPTVR